MFLIHDQLVIFMLQPITSNITKLNKNYMRAFVSIIGTIFIMKTITKTQKYNEIKLGCHLLWAWKMEFMGCWCKGACCHGLVVALGRWWWCWLAMGGAGGSRWRLEWLAAGLVVLPAVGLAKRWKMKSMALLFFGVEWFQIINWI